jgi:hypothetical protein
MDRNDRGSRSGHSHFGSVAQDTLSRSQQAAYSAWRLAAVVSSQATLLRKEYDK